MTNASFTSPMPIPPGYTSAATSRKPPAANAAIRCSGMSAGSVSRRIASATTVPASISLFGMIRKSMSMTVTGTSRSTKASPSQTSSFGPITITVRAISSAVESSTSG